VGHALATGIAAEPDCVIVQLDLRNTFNMLSRQRMLEAVAQRCPSLLPFATWSYATPTPLQLRGSAATIASTRGVRQGDPCGPLFFALALQGPLEELPELDLARPLSYADDIFLGEYPGGSRGCVPGGARRPGTPRPCCPNAWPTLQWKLTARRCRGH
jgi:hypothetical protein